MHHARSDGGRNLRNFSVACITSLPCPRKNRRIFLSPTTSSYGGQSSSRSLQFRRTAAIASRSPLAQRGIPACCPRLARAWSLGVGRTQTHGDPGPCGVPNRFTRPAPWFTTRKRTSNEAPCVVLCQLSEGGVVVGVGYEHKRDQDTANCVRARHPTAS